MGHSNGKITAPVSIADVAAVLGSSSRDVGTLCRHNNINKYSRCKPYAFHDITLLTEDIRKTNNYGMTPTFISNPTGNKWVSPAWGQPQPISNGNWSRLTDFNGYDHNAGKFITSVSLRTNHPKNQHRLMMSGRGRGMLYGDVQLGNWWNEGDVLKLHEFHTPVGGQTPYADWRVTLLVGASDGSDGFIKESLWGVQSEAIGSYSSDELISLKIEITQAMGSVINNGENGRYLAMLCLCPKLTINSDTHKVTLSKGLDWTEMVSLDMWSDGFVQVFEDEVVDAWSDSAIVVTGTTGVSGRLESQFELTAEPERKRLKIEAPNATVYVDSDGKNLNTAYLYLCLMLKGTNGVFYINKRIPLMAGSCNSTTINFICEDDRIYVPYETIRQNVINTDNNSYMTLPVGTYTIMTAAMRATAYGTVSDHESTAHEYRLFSADDQGYDAWNESNSEDGDGAYGISKTNVGITIEIK